MMYALGEVELKVFSFLSRVFPHLLLLTENFLVLEICEWLGAITSLKKWLLFHALPTVPLALNMKKLLLAMGDFTSAAPVAH